jgi:hypothetical protein
MRGRVSSREPLTAEWRPLADAPPEHMNGWLLVGHYLGPTARTNLELGPDPRHALHS